MKVQYGVCFVASGYLKVEDGNIEGNDAGAMVSSGYNKSGNGNMFSNMFKGVVYSGKSNIIYQSLHLREMLKARICI